jgi:hypothetical protein
VRKGISILFALVMILSGAHYIIATHYCGGEVADTKVSLSGKLASCGMEGAEKSCPISGNNLKTHCCSNKTTTIGIINNFTAPVVSPEEIVQNLQKILYAPVRQSLN